MIHFSLQDDYGPRKGKEYLSVFLVGEMCTTGTGRVLKQRQKKTSFTLSLCEACVSHSPFYPHLSSSRSTAQLSQRTVRRSWLSSKQSMLRPAPSICALWSSGTPWADVWPVLRPATPKHLSTSMNCALSSSSMPSRSGSPSPRSRLLLQHQALFSLPLFFSKAKTRVKGKRMQRKMNQNQRQVMRNLPPQDCRRIIKSRIQKQRKKLGERLGNRFVVYM